MRDVSFAESATYLAPPIETSGFSAGMSVRFELPVTALKCICFKIMVIMPSVGRIRVRTNLEACLQPKLVFFTTLDTSGIPSLPLPAVI